MDYYELSNILDRETCKYLVEKINTYRSSIDHNFNRLFIFNEEWLSQKLYLVIQQLFKLQEIKISSTWYYQIYEPNEFIESHIDGFIKLNDEWKSKYTILIYLNDDFEDGNTTIGDVEIIPKIGKALLLKQDILHEGRIVKNGTKIIIRTNILFQTVD